MSNEWTCVEIRRLRELADRPREEIAAALGRSPDAVYRQAKRSGIALAPTVRKANWPADVVRKARELRGRGLSGMKIALRLGVPTPTVEGWLHKGKRAEA